MKKLVLVGVFAITILGLVNSVPAPMEHITHAACSCELCNHQ